MFNIDLINLFFLLFLMSFLSICLNRFYLLMILLSFEFLMLIVFLIMVIYLNMNMMELYFSMFFLTFSVCEGVLGLSILILVVRYHGNDNFQVLNIL
uniref:NADH-ubiquinone oxidoreductase chain 4L n=1 Tax=Strongylogaster xanthocera TaxID=1385064 RepID=A0A7T8G4K4_9HYME|nr:NADH dehydrogenase subunit 4L [Strongylogaster xanthocera]